MRIMGIVVALLRSMNGVFVMIMDSANTVGIMTASGSLNAWTATQIPGTRTKDDHSECEEWCQQNSDRILVQSHIAYHFIISISPTSTVSRLR